MKTIDANTLRSFSSLLINTVVITSFLMLCYKPLTNNYTHNYRVAQGACEICNYYALLMTTYNKATICHNHFIIIIMYAQQEHGNEFLSSISHSETAFKLLQKKKLWQKLLCHANPSLLLFQSWNKFKQFFTMVSSIPHRSSRIHPVTEA